MARLAYSCCGEGRGHSSRTLTMVLRLRDLGHQVRVFASHAAYAALAPLLDDVREIPGLTLAYEHNRVRLRRTASANFGVLRKKARVIEQLKSEIRSFAPDLAITDFEPFLPRAARDSGVPFIALDHQHVIPGLRLRPPPALWLHYLATLAVVHAMHRGEAANLVTSFFHPARPFHTRCHYFGPILREPILRVTPSDQGHVLVYQTSSSFTRLPEILRQAPGEFRIYAFPRHARVGNCVFKPRNHPDFLHDLATCSWVLTNGGYTLISEALHLRKPVLSIPITGQFEQWINSHYLAKLRFGQTCERDQLTPATIRQFQADRDRYRRQIADRNFHGNEEVLRKILSFI